MINIYPIMFDVQDNIILPEHDTYFFYIYKRAKMSQKN
jgi:hypothetical protein